MKLENGTATLKETVCICQIKLPFYNFYFLQQLKKIWPETNSEWLERSTLWSMWSTVEDMWCYGPDFFPLKGRRIFVEVHDFFQWRCFHAEQFAELFG